MNEVDLFIFRCVFLYEIQKRFFSMCFSNNWYQSSLQSHVCITCWVSFRIKENWFHVFENSAVDFFAFFFFFLVLELWFDKTDIDVMMLFKFDFNHAILNFKTIALMKFSFDLNLILIWSRNYVLFKWNVKKMLPKNLKIFSFMSFYRSRIHFDRPDLSFGQSNRNQESIESSRNLIMNFFSFSIDREFLSINRICLSIDQTGIKSRSSHP